MEQQQLISSEVIDVRHDFLRQQAARFVRRHGYLDTKRLARSVGYTVVYTRVLLGRFEEEGAWTRTCQHKINGKRCAAHLPEKYRGMLQERYCWVHKPAKRCKQSPPPPVEKEKVEELVEEKAPYSAPKMTPVAGLPVSSLDARFVFSIHLSEKQARDPDFWMGLVELLER